MRFFILRIVRVGLCIISMVAVLLMRFWIIRHFKHPVSGWMLVAVLLMRFAYMKEVVMVEDLLSCRSPYEILEHVRVTAEYKIKYVAVLLMRFRFLSRSNLEIKRITKLPFSL